MNKKKFLPRKIESLGGILRREGILEEAHYVEEKIDILRESFNDLIDYLKDQSNE